MFQSITNVSDVAPDFFIGIDGGHPVLTPALKIVRVDADTYFLRQHAGAICLVSGTFNMTMGQQTKLFSTLIVPPIAGSVTLTPAAGVTFNGGTAPIVRGRASNPAGFSVIPISLTDFLVGGS